MGKRAGCWWHVGSRRREEQVPPGVLGHGGKRQQGPCRCARTGTNRRVLGVGVMLLGPAGRCTCSSTATSSYRAECACLHTAHYARPYSTLQSLSRHTLVQIVVSMPYRTPTRWPPAAPTRPPPSSTLSTASGTPPPRCRGAPRRRWVQAEVWERLGHWAATLLLGHGKHSAEGG